MVELDRCPTCRSPYREIELCPDDWHQENGISPGEENLDGSV